MKFIFRIAVCFLLLLIFLAPKAVFASTYYVSPSGNDNNTAIQAQNLSSPWKTIQKAAVSVNAGDMVYVRGGTYPEQVSLTKSGNSNARITFTPYQDEVPVIDGSSLTSIPTDGLVQIKDGVNYVTFNGFTVTRSPNMGIANRGSHNIISNNKVRLSYDSAIWHRFGTNTIFRGNEVYFNVRMFTLSSSDTGIVCNGASTWWPATLNSQDSTGALWEGNNVHNNCGEGIVAHDGDKVLGNTFRDNWSVDIYIDSGKNILIDRNSVTDTDTTFVVWPGNGRNIPVGIAIADEKTPCATSNNAISNNVITNARFGISFYPYVSCSGVISTTISNNKFINSWEYGIRIQGSSSQNSGSVIANNIITSSRGKSLVIENPADFKINNNTFYYTGGSSAGQFKWGSISTDFVGWQALSDQITGNRWADPAISEPTDLNKPGDLNQDGNVDGIDYNLLIAKFGNPYTIFDYKSLVANFGK